MKMSRNRKHINPIQGHLLTTQRRLLIELLREAGAHVDAKELYRRASIRDDSISPATVYRSLNLFKQLGLVEEIRLGKVRCYYEIKQAPEHEHLVCHGCGKIIEFKNPLVGMLIDAVRREHGFKVTKAQLYLEGYCAECEEKGKTR